MTKFLEKSFSSRASNNAYREGWDAIFGKKGDEEREDPEHLERCPICPPIADVCDHPVCDTAVPTSILRCTKPRGHDGNCAHVVPYPEHLIRSNPGVSFGPQTDGTYRMESSSVHGQGYSEFRNTGDFIERRSVIAGVASQWERLLPYEVVVYASSEKWAKWVKNGSNG
jgi:hypothetical protein